MKVINLISGPRNISTALMYSFAQRKDFAVLDEPFYGYYLKNANLSITHPSHFDIVDAMECNEDKVVKHIEERAKEQHVFIKGMAHHFLSEEPAYLQNWQNVFLIRHPRKLIASFAKVIANPTLNDIGIKKSSELVKYLERNSREVVVIDSDELMIHPENYLRELCRILDLPFYDEMLSWDQGGIPEDGIWAKHWYANVHKTTGFKVQQKQPAQVPPHLGPLLAEALPYYESLKPYILKNK
ncbi:MAG: sulfotransferase family protein [Flavobacterium sp.]|nr:MAG: sulfotransferase family protein [Flavobacterium sp.]